MSPVEAFAFRPAAAPICAVTHEKQTAEWWRAKCERLDRELLAARAEIRALKLSRDVALRLSAWGGVRTASGGPKCATETQ